MLVCIAISYPCMIRLYYWRHGASCLSSPSHLSIHRSDCLIRLTIFSLFCCVFFPSSEKYRKNMSVSLFRFVGGVIDIWTSHLYFSLEFGCHPNKYFHSLSLNLLSVVCELPTTFPLLIRINSVFIWYSDSVRRILFCDSAARRPFFSVHHLFSLHIHSHHVRVFFFLW